MRQPIWLARLSIGWVTLPGLPHSVTADKIMENLGFILTKVYEKLVGELFKY